MRRFWIGLGLLALFLLAGFWVARRMEMIHRPVSEALFRAAEAALADDWEQAESLTKQARSRWEQHRNFSAALFNHRPMEEIEARFRQLEIYRAREENDQWCAECIYLAQRLEDLAESLRLNWRNLL